MAGRPEILRAATLGGARSVGLEDEVGSLEIGKKADIVLLNLDPGRSCRLNDPPVDLVYAENGSSVTDVLVNGEVVVRNGELTRVDEARSWQMSALGSRDPRSPRALGGGRARHEPHMKALYAHCMAQDTGLNRRADTLAAAPR